MREERGTEREEGEGGSGETGGRVRWDDLCLFFYNSEQA